MDRFFRGLLAGMAGGVVMNVWSLLAFYILEITSQRYLDWSAVILYGSPPNTLGETIYALIVQIVWVGFLGIIFTFLIRELSSRGYLLKGAFYGLIAGFIIYAVPVVLNTKYLNAFSFSTTLSNHLGGILWGVTTAYILRLLDRRGLRQE